MAHAPRPGTTVRLDVRVERAQLTLHEPVVLAYEIVNESGTPVSVDLGYDRAGAFQFDLVATDGTRQAARPTIRFDRTGSARSEQVTIAPGNRYSQRIVLDEWLRFSAPDTYHLTVRFLGGIMSGASDPPMRIGNGRQPPRAGPSLPDQTLAVVVGPRDEQRLQERLRMLQQRLQQGPGTQEFSDAVRELLYVRDPLAVPYLEAAMARELSPLFADSLARIGSPAAVAALERLTSHSTAWVAEHAKRALVSVK